MEKVPMTREGYNKMSEQYQHMRNVELKECLQALTDARDKGDISENAEYEVAKQSLDDLNLRMVKLSGLLSNVQIIEGAINDGTVQLLTYVKILNHKTKVETEYKIVPEHEISYKDGKISPQSPIGKALFGKKIGDKINVDVPAGKLELEILNIRVR